jgi:hypothetical protein
MDCWGQRNEENMKFVLLEQKLGKAQEIIRKT